MSIKTDLSKFDNSWYDTGAGMPKRILWYFVNILFFQSPLNPFVGLKVLLLRLFGAQVGKNVCIKPSVNIKYPWRLFIGDNVWIGENVWIDNLADVIIGNNVCISQGAMLLCGNHDYKKKTFDLIIENIIVREGVWIGARSTICPGVLLNEDVVVTVGSVVTKDLESSSIYQGVPALRIRDRIKKGI